MPNSDEPYVQVSVKLVGKNIFRTFWTQKEKASVGKIVKVEENDGTWSNDWEIIEVYNTVLPKSIVNERSRDYTKQRKASDI